MIIQVTKPSVYELNKFITKGTLLIGKDTDFGITEGKIYIATKNQGENTFYDCIFVINDEDEECDYTGEFFALYEGELVACKE